MASSPGAPLLKAHAVALRTSLQSAGLVPGLAASLLPATRLCVTFGEKPAELATFFRAGECKRAKPVVRFDFAPAESRGGTGTGDTHSFIVLAALGRVWPGTQRNRREEEDKVAEDSGRDYSTELTEYLGPGPKDE